MRLHITVPGVPESQGSLRHVGRGRLIAQNEGRLKAWRSAVEAAAREAWAGTDPLDGPCKVRLTFRLPRPAGHYGTGRNADRLRPSAPNYPERKKDLDKLIRAVFDALTYAAVWTDDSRAVQVLALKMYADHRPPGVTIHLDPIPHAETLAA